MLRVRTSKQAVTDALEAFFRQVIEQGLHAPCDTASYAALLTTLMSATLHQCFTIERLFFGPPVGIGLAGSGHAGVSEG